MQISRSVYANVVIQSAFACGAGQQPCPVLDAGGLSRVLNVTAGSLTLTNVALTNGRGGGTGGCVISLSPITTLTSVGLTNCSSGASGGGVFAAGTLTVTSTTVSNGTALTHGGGLYGAGAVVVLSSTIISAGAGGSGGGVFGGSSVAVTGSTFSGTAASLNGGAVSAASNLTVGSCSFATASAGGNGGAVAGSGTVVVLQSAFVGSSAGGAGGAAFAGSDLNVTGSTFTTSASREVRRPRPRGASSRPNRLCRLSRHRPCCVLHLTFLSAGWHAQDGGALSGAGTVSVSGSTFIGAAAANRGGAVFADGVLIATGSSLSNAAASLVRKRGSSLHLRVPASRPVASARDERCLAAQPDLCAYPTTLSRAADSSARPQRASLRAHSLTRLRCGFCFMLPVLPV